MREFKDRNGSSWQIDITFGSVLRVKEASEGLFNLLDPESLVDNRPLRAIILQEEVGDWGLTHSLLWRLCEAQAGARTPPVTREMFMDLVPVEQIVIAAAELKREWAAFFRLLQRHDIAMGLEQAAKTQDKAVAMVKTKLETIEPQIDAKLDAALKSSCGNWEASLDKILDPTPGVSSGP